MPEQPSTRKVELVDTELYSQYRDCDRWAVIVGVSKYQYPNLNLRYADRDAEELYQLLLTPNGGGFQADHICKLTNEQATTGNITRALRSFLKKPAKEDLVLIYFACHGSPDPDRPCNIYLLTHDTDPKDVAGTALPMEDINRALEDVFAEKVIILADTCHSAAIGGDFGRRRSVTDDTKLINRFFQEISQSKGGVALLTSAEANEVSFEDAKWGGGHGVFTHYLLEGMRGAGDQDNNGIVTIGELFEYVRDSVKQATDYKQHPSIGTSAYDRTLPVSIADIAKIAKEVTQTASQLKAAQSLTKTTLPASLYAYDAETWVGRDQLIASLTQQLRDGCRILAITGITGMGKTALAERLVVEVYSSEISFHRLNFDDRGQGRDFVSGALTLLPKLGETVTAKDQKDPQSALQHLLQALRSHRFLVQIDSLEMLLQGDEQTGWATFTDPLWIDFFQQLLAGETCQSQLLLSSQSLPEELEAVAAHYPCGWHRQDLGGLSEAEQLQLFEKYGLKPDELGSKILRQFVKLYQGHPLVIQVIAKDILDKPFNGNVQQYWQRYQAEFNELERDSQQKGSSPRALKLLVKQRVEQSLQRLPVDSRQMLFCSAVYRRQVPEEFWLVMMPNLTEDRRWTVLELLKSHNLAEQELREDGVLLLRQHNLVRNGARKLLKIDEDMWRAAERTAATTWLNSYEPEMDTPNLEQVRGNLEAFYHYCEIEDWNAAKVLLIDQELGDQLQIWGYYREMVPLYERILGKLGAKVEVVCQRGIGTAYFFLSSYSQATEYLQQSLATARELGDPLEEVRVLIHLGRVYESLSNYPQAIEYNRRLLTIARETSDLIGEGRALGNLGNTYWFLGDYSQATEYNQQYLDLARKIGDRWGEGMALGNQGYVYWSLGNYPQALSYHEQYLTIAHEINDRWAEGRALGGLGFSYLSLGDVAQAIEYFQQQLTATREIGDRQGEAIAIGMWGTALVQIEQYPEAYQHLQTALVIVKNVGWRMGEAVVLLRLGELYYRTGEINQARKFCHQASTLATELGIPLVKECEAFQAMLDADVSPST